MNRILKDLLFAIDMGTKHLIWEVNKGACAFLYTRKIHNKVSKKQNKTPERRVRAGVYGDRKEERV